MWSARLEQAVRQLQNRPFEHPTGLRSFALATNHSCVALPISTSALSASPSEGAADIRAHPCHRLPVPNSAPASCDLLEGSIHITTMPYFDDEDYEFLILNTIDDPVLPQSNAVPVVT